MAGQPRQPIGNDLTELLTNGASPPLVLSLSAVGGGKQETEVRERPHRPEGVITTRLCRLADTHHSL